MNPTPLPILSFLLFAFTTIPFLGTALDGYHHKSLHRSVVAPIVKDILGNEVHYETEYYVASVYDGTLLGATVTSTSCPRVVLSNYTNAVPVTFFPLIWPHLPVVGTMASLNIHFNFTSPCTTSTMWKIDINQFNPSIRWLEVGESTENSVNVFTIEEYKPGSGMYKFVYCRPGRPPCRLEPVPFVIEDRIYIVPSTEPVPFVFVPAKGGLIRSPA